MHNCNSEYVVKALDIFINTDNDDSSYPGGVKFIIILELA